MAENLITHGTLIMQERPLVILDDDVTPTQVLTQLTKVARTQYDQLPIRDHFREDHPALAKFKSNRLHIRNPINGSRRHISYGIFPTITGFSSSCVPNLHYHWDSEYMQLRAVQDIQAGTKLCISYDIDGLLLKRQARQADLLRRYGIRCVCQVCNGNEAEILESDQRRERVLPVVIGKIEPNERYPTKTEVTICTTIYPLNNELNSTIARGCSSSSARRRSLLRSRYALL